MELKDILGFWVDYVALTYHEARNVRYLIKCKYVSPEPYRRLTSAALPHNREDAWRKLQPLIKRARGQVSTAGASRVFGDAFNLSLADLRTLFENKNWKHSKYYGGNAWADITLIVIDLQNALDREQTTVARELLRKLAGTYHNTGRTVSEKLLELNQSLT